MRVVTRILAAALVVGATGAAVLAANQNILGENRAAQLGFRLTF